MDMCACSILNIQFSQMLSDMLYTCEDEVQSVVVLAPVQSSFAGRVRLL